MTDWTFKDFGPQFDEHVVNHLPGYESVQDLVTYLAAFLVPNGGVVADYGASTGRTAATIRAAIPEREIEFWLYDADASMLDIAAERVPGANVNVETLPCESNVVRPLADLTVALWFLQFLPTRDRVPTLRQLRGGAHRGSVLLLATKIREDGAIWQEIAEAYLDDHKNGRGVTLEERVTKTRALRGTMFPASLATLSAELVESGWTPPAILFKLPGWALVAAVAE